MAQDRLAALRAQRQQQTPQQNSAPQQQYQPPQQQYQPPQQQYQPPQQQYQPPQQNGEYEMSGVGGNGRAGGMPAFYAEISSIQDGIAQFNGNVSRISELHSRSLNSVGDSASQQDTAQLDGLVAENRALSKDLKQRIQVLKSTPAASAQDAQVRSNQANLVSTKFMEAIQNYQTVESQYRTKSKQRVERQFKIVKPDATPQEIAAVVDEGQGTQIFAQALTSSSRYGESRTAYREVEARHQDIRKLEQTLSELAQLFNDMAVLVDQQQTTIDNIEKTAAEVEGHTDSALKDTNKAVDSARAARKKRWICFGIFIFVLAVIAIILAIYFGGNHFGSKPATPAATNSTTSG